LLFDGPAMKVDGGYAHWQHQDGARRITPAEAEAWLERDKLYFDRWAADEPDHPMVRQYQALEAAGL
jgi:hypothetical protein